MSALVEAAARKLSVDRTGFEYAMLLPSQQQDLQAEVKPVIEASGAQELLTALEIVVSMEYDRDPESRNFDDERLEHFAALIAKATGKEAA